MPADERLNPASTASEQQIAQLEKRIDDLKQEYILYFSGETRQPPEKKREDLEKAVRKLVFGGAKTARMDLIIQNVAQRFSLYNNLWLKQLNERESGMLPGKKKKAPPPAAPRPGKGPQEVFLTLNDEETFERFAAAYQELLPGGGDEERERIITSIKSKMVTHNLVEARISFSKQHGKLSIRIKK
jgi:hypothetical protein